jgi:hypothetical protein
LDLFPGPVGGLPCVFLADSGFPRSRDFFRFGPGVTVFSGNFFQVGRSVFFTGKAAVEPGSGNFFLLWWKVSALW